MTLMLTLPPRLRLRARASAEPAGRMAWTRRGDRLIVGGAAQTVIIDGATGAEVERWPRAYVGFACGAEDSYVAAATARGCVDVWRFGRPRPGEPRQRHDGAITALAFSDDDRRIFSAGEDGKVGIWRAATMDVAFVPVGGRAHDLAYEARADALAVAAGRGGVVILDGASGRKVAGVKTPDRTTAVAWCEGILFAGTREGQLAAYDAKRLEPVRATVALGAGAIVQLLALGSSLVVEGADAVVILDAATGATVARWTHGVAVAGGSLAVHAAQGLFAVAVPAATALVELAPDTQPAPIAQPPAAPLAPAPPGVEVLALYHPSDEELAAPVLAHLVKGGARVSDSARDPKRVVEAARRGAVAVVLYGPSGPPLRHDYQLDVLETHGARVVPVILPGGVVPEKQRRFHGAAYVCFHERVQDADALARVSRAVLPGLPR